jgi:hypothetical protein
LCLKWIFIKFCGRKIIQILKWECELLSLHFFVCCRLIIYKFNRIKGGKIVIVLAGRFSGRKAVVVKADEEKKAKKFGYALGNK